MDQLNVQCGMLRCLQEYMKNFGTDVQPELSSLKIMLDHHYSGDKEFVANFMLSTIMAMLSAIMFQLSKLRQMVGSGRHDREESIRPMFSPSCIHLLSALNVL